MKILYAEDDEFMQKLIIHNLVKLNHEITVVDDGLEAIQTLEEEDFHLVILDLFMPGAGGLEILKNLRENFKKDTPVLIVSRNESDNAIARAFELGANDYLTKPFSLKDLLYKIKVLTGNLAW